MLSKRFPSRFKLYLLFKMSSLPKIILKFHQNLQKRFTSKWKDLIAPLNSLFNTSFNLLWHQWLQKASIHHEINKAFLNIACFLLGVWASVLINTEYSNILGLLRLYIFIHFNNAIKKYKHDARMCWQNVYCSLPLLMLYIDSRVCVQSTISDLWHTSLELDRGVIGVHSAQTATMSCCMLAGS